MHALKTRMNERDRGSHSFVVEIEMGKIVIVTTIANKTVEINPIIITVKIKISLKAIIRTKIKMAMGMVLPVVTGGGVVIIMVVTTVDRIPIQTTLVELRVEMAITMVKVSLNQNEKPHLSRSLYRNMTLKKYPKGFQTGLMNQLIQKFVS